MEARQVGAEVVREAPEVVRVRLVVPKGVPPLL